MSTGRFCKEKMLDYGNNGVANRNKYCFFYIQSNVNWAFFFVGKDLEYLIRLQVRTFTIVYYHTE